MTHYKSVESCQFLQCQALLHKGKAPQLKTSWQRLFQITTQFSTSAIQSVITTQHDSHLSRQASSQHLVLTSSYLLITPTCCPSF